MLIWQPRFWGSSHLPFRQQVALSIHFGGCTETQMVFGNPATGSHVQDIKHAFRSACVEAGIDDLTFHDLRHTWSTRAAECGVDETVRRDIPGHSSSTITGDYTHSTPASRVAAMELVGAYGDRILDIELIFVSY